MASGSLQSNLQGRRRRSRGGPGQQRSRIIGAKEIGDVLRMLPREIGDRQLNTAVRAGARVVAEAARNKVPVESGKLWRSIRVERVRARRGRLTVGYRIGVGKEAFYGMMLEFGTRFISKRPWLRPAFEESHLAILEAMGTSLKKGIERAARKLAGGFAKSGLARRPRRRR